VRQESKFDITNIPISDIVIVITSDADYSMNRVMLAEPTGARAISSGERWLLIHGSHCSCYGFDETEWDATWYNTDELLKVIKGWLRMPISDYSDDAEVIAAPIIKRYILSLSPCRNVALWDSLD